MLDAIFMKTLAYSYLQDNVVEKRIHAAASLGNISLSFAPYEISPGMHTLLVDSGYSVSADTFHPGNLYVTWG